jgi:hypothetical protein
MLPTHNPEALLERLTGCAAARSGVAHSLAEHGLPYPQPTTASWRWKICSTPCAGARAPRRYGSSSRFQTRGGRAPVLGDPDAPPDQSDAALAHRFTVLVPEQLGSAEAAMVERVVDL